MIETQTAWITTIVFASVAVFYAVMMFISKHIFADVERDFKLLRTGERASERTSFQQDKELVSSVLAGGDQRALAFRQASDRVLAETLSLFGYQTISMLLAAALFSLTFLLWFSLEGQYIWLFFPFVFGCLVTVINSLIVLVVSSKARPRQVFSAQEEKERTFSEGFIINSGIVSGTLGLFILITLFAIPQMLSWYKNNHNEKDDLTNGLFNSLAFAVGTCLSSVFYRDIGSTFGKGVSVAADSQETALVNLNTPQGTAASGNLKYGQMIGNCYSSSLTTLLDFQNLVASLIVVTMLLSTGKDDLHLAIIYLILYLLSLNVLITLVVLWIAQCIQSIFRDQSTSQYVSSQIRIQYVIINIVSFLTLFILPLELDPTSISIGKDGAKTPSFYDSEISQPDLVWCLQIGQLVAFLLFFLSELWTSYGFAFVRSISKKLKTQSIGDGIVAAEASGSIGTAVFLLILGFTLYLGYYFGGVLGLNWVTVGIIQTSPILLIVTFFSQSTNDSVQLAHLNNLEYLCNRLRLVNWSSANFSSFSQLLNISGGLFVNLLAVAALIYLAEAQKLILFSGPALYGFLISLAVILTIKAVNSLGIQKVAQSLNEGSGQIKINNKFDESNLKSLNDVVISQFFPAFVTVLINLGIVLVAVLLTSWLLDTTALIGLTLGLALFGVATSFYQLIVGTTLKNAQNYSDQSALIQGDVKDKNEYIVQTKECGFFASALHQVPGTGILNYVHLIVLILVLGAKSLKEYGILDKYMVPNSSNVSGSTVDWYLDAVNGEGKK